MHALAGIYDAGRHAALTWVVADIIWHRARWRFEHRPNVLEER